MIWGKGQCTGKNSVHWPLYFGEKQKLRKWENAAYFSEKGESCKVCLLSVRKRQVGGGGRRSEGEAGCSLLKRQVGKSSLIYQMVESRILYVGIRESRRMLHISFIIIFHIPFLPLIYLLMLRYWEMNQLSYPKISFIKLKRGPGCRSYGNSANFYFYSGGFIDSMICTHLSVKDFCRLWASAHFYMSEHRKACWYSTFFVW